MVLIASANISIGHIKAFDSSKKALNSYMQDVLIMKLMNDDIYNYGIVEEKDGNVIIGKVMYVFKDDTVERHLDGKLKTIKKGYSYKVDKGITIIDKESNAKYELINIY